MAEQVRPALLQQMNLEDIPIIDIIFTTEDEIMNGFAMWTYTTFIWVDQNDAAIWLEDEKWLHKIHDQMDATDAIGELMKTQERLEKQGVDNTRPASPGSETFTPTAPEEEDDLRWYRQLYENAEFKDDVRGGALGKELMIRARRAEIQFFKKLGVYNKVRRDKNYEDYNDQVGRHQQGR